MRIAKIGIALLLSVALIVVPVTINSKVQAVAISSFVIGLVLAVFLALGYTFTVNNSDISSYIETAINSYLNYKNYNSVNEWLGNDYTSNITTSGVFVGLPYSVWEATNDMVKYTIDNNNIPVDGSVSNPVESYVTPKYFLANVDIPQYNYTISQYPLYTPKYLGTVYSRYHSVYEVNFPIESFLVMSYSQLVASINNLSITYSVNGINRTENLRQYTPVWAYYIQQGYVTMSNYAQYTIDINRPIEFGFTISNVGSSNYTMSMFFYDVYGRHIYINYSNGSNGTNYAVNPNDITISSSGLKEYPEFNLVDRVYIDLQQGDLLSGLQALTNVINQVNQNLIQATIALQESNASNLPVDTTPFIQLVQSYEELTNDVISGEVSITSGIASMYTLLSGSITNITNPTLTNACISAYNAFLNKLSLFQSAGGGSAPNYTYTTVQTLQGQLDTLYSNYESGNITYSNMLTFAASDLSDAVADATSTQEIISLNSVYQSFLENVGATIQSSAYTQDVLDNFEDTLEDWRDGTISREEAIAQLQSQYRLGIQSAKTAVDAGVVISGYQAALDTIAVQEFDITSELGEVSADTIALEDDLVELLDLTQLETYLDFQHWTYLNLTEANLYREYFQRFNDVNSPFYVYIYAPLVLGIVAAVLGTGFVFRSKAHDREGEGK